MDVVVSSPNGGIKIQFICDNDDGIYNNKVEMDKHEFNVDFSGSISVEHIHPDHLALAIILVANPFVGKLLNLPFAVSEQFLLSTKIISRYEITCLDGHVSPYSPRVKSRPGLSFSGGADSTAALLLMPKNSISVFMDRPLVRGASLYNKSAAYATIKHAQDLGYDVRAIGCDLEYIRSPLGFPSDLSPSIPLLLMSSELNIDSIAFGTILEAAYRVGHEISRDYAISGHYRVWGGMFAAAGIPLYLPVAGISEVGTSKIVHASSFRDFTRSCIRGKWPKSCNNCWKCFRKNLVEMRITGQSLSDGNMLKWLNVREVKRKLSSWPISHENVLSWSLQGSNSSGRIVNLLLARLEGSVRNMDFLENWYYNSIGVIPKQYQDYTEKEISKYLKIMKDSDTLQITTHSMVNWLESPIARSAKNSFQELIQ